MRRTVELLTLLLGLLAFLPASANAQQTASLRVSFTPEHLGQPTNVAFSIHIAAPRGSVPPPMTGFDLRYPSQLGLAVSGLGLVSCPQSTLELLGAKACPADSHMGAGTALAEVPFGPEIIHESAPVAILRAAEESAHLAILFYVEAHIPITLQVGFPGLLLPGPSPAQETIHIAIPLVESLPEGPYVAVIQLHAMIGPRGLTYYEHTGNRLIPYHPQGVLLPHICPRGGFPFAATFTFIDGTQAHAKTSVPCPSHSGAHAS